MVEIFNQAWVKFAAIAAGVAVLAGFIGNVGKIVSWVKERAEKRKKRREAPAETLALVKAMQVNIHKLECNVSNVITKVNSLDGRVDVITDEVRALKKESESQSAMLINLDSDTADLLASQLTREHDFYVLKGFCPTHEKERIGMIYDRYKKRGRNHIADHLMDDLLALPIKKVDE